jgi:uncharacterized protein YecE (DUF72 family)
MQRSRLAFEREHGLVNVVVDGPQVGDSAPAVSEVTSPKLAIVRMHGRNHETWDRVLAGLLSRDQLDDAEGKFWTCHSQRVDRVGREALARPLSGEKEGSCPSPRSRRPSAAERS